MIIRQAMLDDKTANSWYQVYGYGLGKSEPQLNCSQRVCDPGRHEQAHDFHEQNPALVDGWLWEKFGWQMFNRSDKDMDGWISLMEPNWDSVDDRSKQEVREIIRQALGLTPWQPSSYNQPPIEHIWWREGFGPRLALDASIKEGKHWWVNHQFWHQTNYLAFSYNFFHKKLMVLDSSTLVLLNNMSDSYAAMSPTEFFAELYVLYYNNEASRSFLNRLVCQWFDEHVGEPEVPVF